MSYQTIPLSQEGGIATITLSRPEVMNGLNASMRREITAAVQERRLAAALLAIVSWTSRP